MPLKLRIAIIIVAVVIVATVTTIAGVENYWHITAFVARYHQGGTLGHWYAATIDGILVVASVALLIGRVTGAAVPRFIYVVAVSGILMTLGANISDGAAVSGHYGVVNAVITAIVTAWPAWAFFAGFETLLLLFEMLTHGKARTQAVTGETAASLETLTGALETLADETVVTETVPSETVVTETETVVAETVTETETAETETGETALDETVISETVASDIDDETVSETETGDETEADDETAANETETSFTEKVTLYVAYARAQAQAPAPLRRLTATEHARNLGWSRATYFRVKKAAEARMAREAGQSCQPALAAA